MAPWVESARGYISGLDLLSYRLIRIHLRNRIRAEGDYGGLRAGARYGTTSGESGNARAGEIFFVVFLQPRTLGTLAVVNLAFHVAQQRLAVAMRATDRIYCMYDLVIRCGRCYA